MDKKLSVSVDTWHVAPEDQGQMVERAYGADWESRLLWRRERDQATGETSYAHASADSLVGEWAPWNRAPEAEWVGVSALTDG